MKLSIISRSVAICFFVTLSAQIVAMEAFAQNQRPSPPPAYKVLVHPAPPPAFESSGLEKKVSKQEASAPETPLSTLYSHGNPTAEEQYLLELINRARANPDSEGIRLATTTDPDILRAYQQWGTPTPANVRSDFSTYAAQPPLAFNADLITAARGHDQAMIQYDSQYHVGPDGTPAERMANAGYVSTGYSGENVFAFGVSMWDIHASFNIDFGNSNLGHRENIMNFQTPGPLYTEIGIGVVHHPGQYPDVGPIVTTYDFGTKNQNFILGVAYTDYNHNSFYDIGEGDSGVKITVLGGSYYAITSGSGGYAIPYSGSGSVQVTASGGPFPTPVTKTIDFEGQNVKVDFNPDLTGYPTQATLVIPQMDTTVIYDSVTFTWNTIALANSYHIQIGTDSLLKQKLLLNDSGWKDTSFRFGMFKDSTTYYWRVQGKNAKGLGPWSPIAAFTVALAPDIVGLVAPSNNAVLPDTNVSFLWHMADKLGTSYALEIASDKAMKNLIWSDSLWFDPTDTNAVIPADTFKPGQPYYWTVLAQNDNGWSASGTPSSFTISSAGVNPQTLRDLAVSLAPNPTVGRVHIHFMLATPEAVTLRIFNSLGEQVQQIAMGTRPAGENEYDLDGSSLAAGTYSFELRVGERFEMGRLVVIR